MFEAKKDGVGRRASGVGAAATASGNMANIIP